ncbi:DUF2326 domain-containing protein [Pseudomonas moraviensis]|jgi:uncharacterized protein YydD (DUF2326 family)|uniref:DUF2326 domain-containing protein n=1 Tax=Pseudomonas moraviensis TaxID=321662 RepID=UPI00080E50E7|nr:DUF2326 domain-containing protein [Pseudomonas moraviensis]
MRLIELYANKASFKRVVFNQSGLSIVLGSRKEPDNHADDNKSYNGVGKSLLAEIIHFCLGSNSNSAFKNHLAGWEFNLVLQLGTKKYHVIRSTDKQGEVLVNEKNLKLKQYTEFLGKHSFQTQNSEFASKLSFRALISRFIRRNKADYNDPRLTSSDKEPYTTLLRNLYLLGIDISLVEKKYQLRVRQTQLELFEKNFKTDPFIREYYTGNKDAFLQSKHLEVQIEKLVEDLDKFQVAEDYYDIEKSANQLTSDLRILKNRKVVIENAIANLERSLESRTDISLAHIKDVYGELLLAFKPEVLKSLSEVEKFHNDVITNRYSRLIQEKNSFESQLRSLEVDIKEKNSEVDKKLIYLSDKRALDQYASVSAQLSDIKAKHQKLIDYQQLLHRSREEAAEVKVDLAAENLKTNLYLDDTSLEREEKLSMFSWLAKKFYPDVPAGITINNNSGDNKIRYDFDVRIEADGSDGINAVKLFCYDLTVILLRINHEMRLVWHDSRLFSDIDPRQRAILFKTAALLSKEYGFQYIATVNEDQIDGMLSELDEDQKRMLKESVVLRLNDDGPEGKLLGVQVDMQY